MANTLIATTDTTTDVERHVLGIEVIAIWAVAGGIAREEGEGCLAPAL